MDTNETGQQGAGELEAASTYTGSGGSSWPLNRELLRRFFDIAGGSVLYCASAVLVAYGVSRVLGPVLSDTETLAAALPCVGTLWAYEVALLAVLVLIVSRKVVDDAVSVVIIIALYMVAGAVALGTVADRDIDTAILLAIAATAFAAVKLIAMRLRFVGVQIPFGLLPLAGLIALAAVHYFGPLWMSRLMIGDAADEAVRRGRWFAIQIGMMAGIGLVWLDGLRVQAGPWWTSDDGQNRPFLRSSAMVQVFGLVLLAASGAHVYAIGYMYALPEYAGDYLPMIALGSLLLLEILPRSGVRFGAAHVATACLPLAALGYTIWQSTVGSVGGYEFDLIAYPPVYCGLTGIAIAITARRRRWRPLAGVVFLYALGVILTYGFSPDRAHSLNVWTCGAVLTAAMMAYGIESWQQYYCVAAVGLMTLGASLSLDYLRTAGGAGLTQIGAVMGVGGIGIIALAMLFGKGFDRGWRLLGALCVALFTYDLLGTGFGARHAIGLILIAFAAIVLWYRSRDRISVAVLTAGGAGRVYLAAGVWRHVLSGFIALAVGAAVSLRKRRRQE